MLTCKPEDPRWSTLADLRTKWAEVQQLVTVYDLRGRYEDAAQEVKNMLTAAADGMRNLSQAPARLSVRARHKLGKKITEVDTYIRNYDLQLPGWRKVVDAEKYISEKIVAGYEEAAIRYVARRRKFNAYRKDLADRLRTGKILTVDLCKITYAVVSEVLLACRFGMGLFMHR
jgi:hypothetical protein